jgi:hypothetical protein
MDHRPRRCTTSRTPAAERPHDPSDPARGIVAPAVQYPAEPLKTETADRGADPAEAGAIARGSRRALPGRNGPARRGSRAGRPVGARAGRPQSRAAVDGLADGFRHHGYLRHYFAPLLIASGADVKTVQGRLRHASAKTLDTPTATCGPTATSRRGRPWKPLSSLVRNLCGMLERCRYVSAGQRPSRP